jgi:hypothetical protein
MDRGEGKLNIGSVSLRKESVAEEVAKIKEVIVGRDKAKPRREKKKPKKEKKKKKGK